MTLCTIGTRSVVSVEMNVSASKIASTMRERSLGSVVVVRDGKPVGMVTDRDLVMRVMCEGKAPDAVTAEDVMTAPVFTVARAGEPLEAARLMRERQVRRLPVVNEDGTLCGIVCLDDLTHHLSRIYREVSEAISNWPVPYEGG